MKLSLVLVLALGCLAAAGPHGDGAPQDRQRRFLVGWNWGDSFFHNVAAEVHRAWAAAAHWTRNLFVWVGHHPEHSTVYRVRLPHGSGVVAVIDASHHGNGLHHHADLVWDGKQLSWQSRGKNATSKHGEQHKKDHETVTVTHAGVTHKLPLAALAKHLKHVPAGSRIKVDIRGSSWHNLKVVLTVVGQHGGDKAKSVSVHLSTLLKDIKEHQQNHSSESAKHSSKKDSSKKDSSKDSSKKSSSKDSSKKSSSKDSSKKSSSKDSSKKSSSKDSSKKSSSKKSHSKLRWDGHELQWADVKPGKHVRRQIRVTKDGVVQIVPFPVIAEHLKTVPAGSDIKFKITGHTLKDLRVVLSVRGHGHKKQTISLPVSKLLQEAEASRHGASAKQGKVLASKEVKQRDQDKGKKAKEVDHQVKQV